MAMSTPGGAKRWIAAAILSAGLAAPPAAAQAPATTPPAAALEPGTASGTLTVGTTTVNLTHAYVAGPTSDLYVVELTDRPIPEEALAAELRRGGGQGFLRSGKAQGLLFYLTDKGFVVTVIPFAGDVRGDRMLGSLDSFDSFTIAAGRATGAGAITAEKTNQGWSFKGRFAATVRPVK
jgi:hypothetical protein